MTRGFRWYEVLRLSDRGRKLQPAHGTAELGTQTSAGRTGQREPNHGAHEHREAQARAGSGLEQTPVPTDISVRLGSLF